MPSILILIPSVDNKHTINVTIYIGFHVYAQFQRREKEECQGVFLEDNNVPILEAQRMKIEDKMCQLRKKLGQNVFTNIYIYIRVFL